MVISETQQMLYVFSITEFYLSVVVYNAYTRQIVHAHIIPSSMYGTMYVLTSAYTINTDKNYGIINYRLGKVSVLFLCCGTSNQ